VTAIATKAELFVEITRFLDGEDPTVSDLSTDTLERCLTVAQRRIYREVKSRWNENEFSGVTVTNNLAPLPTDYVSASIVHFGKQALKPVPEEVIRDNWASTGGSELYFADIGANLTFWPAIADGTALEGRYFAALPDLTDANFSANLLMANADDLFVYAALVESAPFFGARQDMPTWEAKYQSIVDALNTQRLRGAHSGGRMQRRAVSICGRGRGG
jgi:hypothetical protein